MIRGAGPALVVHHTAETHKAVEKFLTAFGVKPLPTGGNDDGKP